MKTSTEMAQIIYSNMKAGQLSNDAMLNECSEQIGYYTEVSIKTDHYPMALYAVMQVAIFKELELIIQENID
ncbi:hypothetical protein [Elizabethkingia meningoseptica]|uniref:hypothetical protein n=1 Tax=Elizabethkingia meningoseptica TaxID=238 RepID=UPI0029F6E86D|nr:hypothetical protein [Elizabethkingia anophelis]